MQKSENSTDFQTSNPFSSHFEQFGKTRLFDRLQSKFTPKPYYYQYRTLRAVVLGASFLFHILSAATAAALIFLFIFNLLPHTAAAGAITFAALLGLELSKRETSGRFFHDALQFGKFSPGLLFVVVGLAAVSTACSYYGAEKAVRQLTPPPALVNADSITAPIQGQIATIDQQITDARKTKWKGKTTVQSQRTIERLSRQKEKLTDELIRRQERTDTRNDATETDHATTTAANAEGFALFTLGCELLLLLCLWYLQFYDFRSFAEYCRRPAASKPDAAGFGHRRGDSLAGEMLHNSNGNGHHNANGTPAGMMSDNPAHGATWGNYARRPIGFFQVYDNRTNENRTTTTADHLRTCAHCGNGYEHRHAKQKYCTDACRVAAWESRTGQVLKRGKGKP